jgi:hypothetical protein
VISAGVRQQGRSRTFVDWFDIVRMLISWGLLFYAIKGSAELWWSVTNSLWYGKQFACAAPLLVFGAVFPMFRERENRRLATMPQDDGSSHHWLYRSWLWGMVVFAWLNLIPNMVTAPWATWNNVSGRTPWALQDVCGAIVGVASGLLILIFRKKGKLSNQMAKCLWAVSWRMLIILITATAVWTPDVTPMPLAGAKGMAKIGLLAFTLVSMRQFDLKLKIHQGQPLRQSFRQGWWSFAAEVGNFAACLVLLVLLQIN